MTAGVAFPELLYGPFTSLHRQTLREGKRWAQHYQETGQFPAPALRPVEPQAVIHTLDVTDLDRGAARWRLYFTQRLARAVLDAQEWEQPGAVRSDFEAYVCQFSWGALSAALGHVFPNSIPRVSARLEALLRFWDELDGLRYVDQGPVRVVSLTEVVQRHFAGLLDMWLDAPTGDIRADLRLAIDAMRRATPDSVRQRVARALSAAAQADERTRGDARLADPAWLAGQVAELDPAQLDDLETGYQPRLLRLLFILRDAMAGGQP